MVNFYNIYKIIITTNSEKYLPFPSHLHSAQAISFREGVGAASLQQGKLFFRCNGKADRRYRTNAAVTKKI